MVNGAGAAQGDDRCRVRQGVSESGQQVVAAGPEAVEHTPALPVTRA